MIPTYDDFSSQLKADVDLAYERGLGHHAYDTCVVVYDHRKSTDGNVGWFIHEYDSPGWRVVANERAFLDLPYVREKLRDFSKLPWAPTMEAALVMGKVLWGCR